MHRSTSLHGLQAARRLLLLFRLHESCCVSAVFSALANILCLVAAVYPAVVFQASGIQINMQDLVRRNSGRIVPVQLGWFFRLFHRTSSRGFGPGSSSELKTRTSFVWIDASHNQTAGKPDPCDVKPSKRTNDLCYPASSLFTPQAPEFRPRFVVSWLTESQQSGRRVGRARITHPKRICKSCL